MAQALLSAGPQHSTLPESYIRPEAERPRMAEVLRDDNFPTIDLSCPDKSHIISKVAEACRSYGVFQVVNHGISSELIEAVVALGREFFHLPAEEKAMFCSDDPSIKTPRLWTSVHIPDDPVQSWRDSLRLPCHPLDKHRPDWPSNPPSLKDVVCSYALEVRRLCYRLLGILSLALGLEEDYIEKVFGEQEQNVLIHYYPQCPEPDLTFGLPPHTDPNAITILLQDQRVAGLQFLKEGKWLTVDPRPDALLVNIGDQLQALSNATYKSVWHRVVVNSSMERISAATFFAPHMSTVISPAEKLVSSEGLPAIYRTYTYAEYYDKYAKINFSKEQCLEYFKC